MLYDFIFYALLPHTATCAELKQGVSNQHLLLTWYVWQKAKKN